MEYHLMVAPDLDLAPADIATAWNADTQASSLAQALLTPSPTKQFNPLLDTIVTLVVASGGTVGLGLLTNALYDVLKAAVRGRNGQHPQKHLKITQFDQPDGTHLLVIEQDEHYQTSPGTKRATHEREAAMTRILIEEWTNGPSGTNARVSFDGGPVYRVRVTSPFTPEQEQRLEWYFEEYLNFPLINEVRAREAAASIVMYGEQLFTQVFADHRAYAAYIQYKAAGINSLHFEIAGSFDFHDLHWEALKDPDWPHPFVLDTTMVRKNLIPAPAVATVRSSPTINILVVTARPDGRNDVNYPTISRPMIGVLRQANLKVLIDLVRPGTYMTLSQHLEATTTTHGTGYYHVIHFDVHGAVLDDFCVIDQCKLTNTSFLFQLAYSILSEATLVRVLVPKLPDQMCQNLVTINKMQTIKHI